MSGLMFIHVQIKVEGKGQYILYLACILLILSLTSFRVIVLLLQFIAKKSFSSLISVLTLTCFFVDMLGLRVLLLWLTKS
jgi:uncharacterized membrane protein